MIQLPKNAQAVIDSLKNAGFSAYAVGGSVRDLIMGKQTAGWDFTTSATPEEILHVFPDSFYDNAFGTVGIKLYTDSDKQEIEDVFEVTTYRSEKGYKDHRHPDSIIWGTSIEEDLSRRDFTMNAIATDGVTIIDPYNGQDDIAKKIIRTVGVASDRIAEDALRMMRAVRQASQLGFMIDEETTAAISANTSLLMSISIERIRDELFRLLGSQYASDGIMLLKNTGILDVILPELTPAFSVGQKSPKRHHIYDVGTHLVMSMKLCPSNDPVVRFATLLHDIGKIQTHRITAGGIVTFYNHEVVGARIVKSICARLKLSKKDSEKIYTLVRWHQFTVDERQTDSALRRFIRHVGKENLDDMLALRTGDRLGGGARETSWRLELFKKRLDEVQKQPFTVADLKVDGHDVMKELGVKPGPIIGKILKALFAEVEAETLQNDKDALLKRMKEIGTSIH